MTDLVAAGQQPVWLDELADQLSLMPDQDRARFLDRLPPDQATLAERALGRRNQQGWRADPNTMAVHLTHGARKPWAYARLLATKFVEAIRGQDTRQLWNLPSQYGKTTCLVTDGVPWALQDNPRLRIMYLSYDANKAVEESRKARDMIEEHPELGIRIRPDIRAAGKWNTPQGGFLYATGIHGAITGWPIDVLLVDDLLKGWQEAHSETARNTVWTILQSSGRMRLQGSHCPIIMAGTRWHEDDPFGRALFPKEDSPYLERWTLVRLPAIAEQHNPDSDDFYSRQPDPLGRAPGEVLEPERFDLLECRRRFAAVGTYLGNAMEQQRPGPEEGTDIKRAWFQLSESVPPRFDVGISSWDMTMKDKETSDFVVGQVWGRLGSARWLLDEFRGQWDQGTTANAIALCKVRWPWLQAHVIENTARGPEVIAELSQAMPNYVVEDATAVKLGMTEAERRQVQQLRRLGMTALLPENPKGDKRIRMRAFIPTIEGKNVWMWVRAPWLAGFLAEVTAFPNGANDDRVDAMSQALKRLAAMGGAMASAARMGQGGAAVTSPTPGQPRRLPAPPQRGQIRRPGH